MSDIKQTVKSMQAGLFKHGFITSLGIGVKMNSWYYKLNWGVRVIVPPRWTDL